MAGNPDFNNGNPNIYLTVITGIFFLIAKLSVALSDVATIATITAAGTTAAYNLYKFYKDIKSK